MVTYIKYRWTQLPPDLDNISTMEDPLSCKSSRTTIKSAKSVGMRLSSSKSKIFEENRTLMVNSDCPIQILIDYVASEIQFDKTRDFDFCNSDGELIGISNLDPWENAKTIMPPNKTYVIVFIERNLVNEYVDYEVFLKKGSDIYNEYKKKLKRIVPFRRDTIQIRSMRSMYKSAPSKMLQFNKSQSVPRIFNSKGSKSEINM